MCRNRTMAALVIGCLLPALTGCAGGAPETSPSLSGTASPTPTATSRWGAPSQPKLEDRFTDNAYVDPDGVDDDISYGAGYAEQLASEPSDPIPIAKDGNIFIRFTLTGGQVSRFIEKSYVSTDAKGKEHGPKITCARTANAVPQTFNCAVQFVDHDYASGIYYGIFITAPAQNGDQEYGSIRVSIPVYTTLPD